MTGPRRAGSATGFVLPLGLVSLLADATYEGARSVAGPYLAILGAGAAAVSIVSGAGELLGYGLRLLSGYWSDRLRSPWTLALAGLRAQPARRPLPQESVLKAAIVE